jgi:hypothetical protein
MLGDIGGNVNLFLRPDLAFPMPRGVRRLFAVLSPRRYPFPEGLGANFSGGRHRDPLSQGEKEPSLGA